MSTDKEWTTILTYNNERIELDWTEESILIEIRGESFWASTEMDHSTAYCLIKSLNRAIESSRQVKRA